jgi:Tat protein secretion system quality control protein TatD with DNase activity
MALRSAVEAIPLNRLLLETDTYPLPGRTTEPADIGEICRAVAELRQLDPDIVAKATTDNYLRLLNYRLPLPTQ